MPNCAASAGSPKRSSRRLYITRQAVSRWECGATEPSIDMLKLIARELDVPVTELLDMPEHYCQSCGMMFTAPGQHGHEADGSEARRLVAMRARWLRMYWPEGTYTPEAHKGLADGYIADERFQAYYGKVAPGAAQFLRDAIRACA